MEATKEGTIVLYGPNGDAIYRVESPVIRQSGEKRQIFGGNHTATPVIDTETGVVYASKYRAGVEMGPGIAKTDPKDKRAWYKMIRVCPGRFVEVNSN